MPRQLQERAHRWDTISTPPNLGPTAASTSPTTTCFTARRRAAWWRSWRSARWPDCRRRSPGNRSGGPFARDAPRTSASTPTEMRGSIASHASCSMVTTHRRPGRCRCSKATRLATTTGWAGSSAPAQSARLSRCPASAAYESAKPAILSGSTPSPPSCSSTRCWPVYPGSPTSSAEGA